MALSVSSSNQITSSLLRIYLNNHSEIPKKYHTELLNYEKELFTILDIYIYWKRNKFSNNLLEFLDKLFDDDFMDSFKILHYLTEHINELCLSNNMCFDIHIMFVACLYLFQYIEHVSYDILNSNTKDLIKDTYLNMILVGANLNTILPRRIIKKIVNEMPQKDPIIMEILNSI